MAIKYNFTKFPTAFPSKVIARDGGAHMFSLKHDDDLWNGAVVAKGDYEALDLYKAKDAVKVNAKVVDMAANGNYYVEILEDQAATDALIVYNPPVIEEEYNKSFLLESNFYIPAEMELTHLERVISGSFLRMRLPRNLLLAKPLLQVSLVKSGQLRN